MRVYIDEDEWYPVFYILKDDFRWGREVEMSEEQQAEILEAFAKFHQAQAVLRKMYEDAKRTQGASTF
jgi:hypothetical protein